MYYLLEFESDNSIDIVEGQNVIMENETAEIGEKVSAFYSIGKRKMLYEAKVANRSEDYATLKEEMERRLEECNEETTELGRGKRTIKRKKDLSDDEEATPDLKPKKIKSKGQTQKLHKVAQQKQTAKDLMQKISEQRMLIEPQSNQMTDLLQEVSNLKDENHKLKLENKRLRRERAEALDVSRLLQTAVTLVEGLKTVGKTQQLSCKTDFTSPPVTFKKTLSTSTITSPSPSAHSLFSAQSPTSPSTSSLLKIVTSPPYTSTTSTDTAPTSTPWPSPSLIPGNEDERIAGDEVYPPEFLEQDMGQGDDDGMTDEKKRQLLFSGKEKDVVRLVEGKDIFVLKAAKLGLQYSKNQTTAVRSGLKAVFRDDALLSCSVKGGIAKGPLGKPEEKRKPLLPEGVSALIEFSNKLAEEKNQKRVPEKDLISAMGTKLSEMRAAASKKTT